MRLNEIASAAEQLALWKLVSDSVWAAINTQARQEAESKAAARAAKPKPVRGSRSKASAAPYAAPPKPLPKPKPLNLPKHAPNSPAPLPQTAAIAPVDQQNQPSLYVQQQTSTG